MGLVLSRSWEPQQTQTFETAQFNENQLSIWRHEIPGTHLHLHAPGLNVCRYCRLRCFKSPTRSTVLWQVSWTSKRGLTIACRSDNVLQQCWLAYTFVCSAACVVLNLQPVVRSAAYVVLNLQPVVQFCGYLNLNTTSNHSLPTLQFSAGMLFMWNVYVLNLLQPTLF